MIGERHLGPVYKKLASSLEWVRSFSQVFTRGRDLSHLGVMASYLKIVSEVF